MHVVVVVDCGRVGSSLARRLTAESYTVAIIDKRGQSFDRFLLDWPGTKIVGYGFDRDRLSEAGIERADALAAVTSGDNSNIIVARIAKEFSPGQSCARYRDWAVREGSVGTRVELFQPGTRGCRPAGSRSSDEHAGCDG